MSYHDLYLRLICDRLTIKKNDVIEYETLYLGDYSIEIARKLQEEIKEKDLSYEEYSSLEQKINKDNLDLIRVEKVVIKSNYYLVALFFDPYKLYDNPSLIDLIEVTSRRCNYLITIFNSWKL